MEENCKWWQKAVVYQIYPRSFKDSNGDGIGDLRGIIEKLDYLNDGTEGSLGVDAIWLNPLYPSPQYDFGYDIMDHRGIDPQYGTMEDFELLVSEAHKRNIRIIMDFVPSVTSHLHPWFIESRSSRTSPKRDWYIWKDAPRPGKCPTNWLGVFGGKAWDYDRKTGQYYYHNSLPEQPDLNWRNPEVERAMLDNMEFWLKKGVDGFRIDVLNYVYKDDQFRDNPHCFGLRPYDMQRHIYDKDRPEAVEVGKKMRALVDRYGDKMLVAEIYVDSPAEAARYYGEKGDGVNLAFNFSFIYSRFCAEDFRNEVAEWEKATAARGGWPCYFLSNHDVKRHISRYSKGRWTEHRAGVAAAMLLTLRGTPFLYMGEEFGMRSCKIKRRDLMDPIGVHYWPFIEGRDCARTPLQWSGGEYAGFSTHRTWLPVNEDYNRINAQLQENDPKSLLNIYRRLVWLRKVHPALAYGDYMPLERTPRGIFGYFRTAEGERILVLLNFAGRKKTVGLPQAEKSAGLQVLFGNYRDKGVEIKPGNVTLSPYEFLILLARVIAGI